MSRALQRRATTLVLFALVAMLGAACDLVAPAGDDLDAAAPLQEGSDAATDEPEATDEPDDADGAGGDAGDDADGAPALDCPDVAATLGEVPAGAQDALALELGVLENQIAADDARLVSTQGEGGPNFIDNAILGPLEDKRTAVIDRIEIAFRNAGAQPPPGLGALAACTLQG